MGSLIKTGLLKEIFSRNFNLLNRLNLISIDNNGTLYNGYIGTSYDESDKSVMHIGTTNMNINIGSDTLMNEIDKDKFNVHNTLSLDFDNIILNANKSIHLTKEANYTENVGNINFNISSFKLLDITSTILNYSLNTYSISTYTDSLFAVCNGTDYFLNVNALMKKFNKNIGVYTNAIVDCLDFKDGEEYEFNINKYKKPLYYGDDNTPVYLYKLPNNILFKNVVNNSTIVYSSKIVEVMYYETSTRNEDNQIINNINIFLSFK